MNFLTLLCLSIFVTASFGFFIDDFKANENSSIISTLDISIDSSQKGLEFPNYFTAIITDLITKKVLFVKINKTNDKYPIASDDVYTLDSKKKLVKVSLFSANNEPYEVYKSQDGKSVATLIKNADSSANPYRMLATINTDESKDLTYNVLPIIDRTKSPKKRILASSSGHVSYDSKLNSHAIIRNTLKDFKFNDQPKLTENIKVIEKKTSRNKRSNNGVPFNLVVEYLVVVDSSVYNDHVTYAQSTNSDLVYQYIRTYFAHYVNSINQRYLNSFQNDADLRISVKLKNILIFQNQADCPWTDPNQVGISFYSTYNNKQVIAIDKTLNAFSSYMNSQTFNFTFDHAIALFDKDLWDSSQVANPSSASQVVGYSPIKGICTNSKYSLGEEIGGFRNAIVAAHELGHNLGAYHDGTLGDQFSTGCSASDNYLMTAGLNTYPLDSTNFANNLRLSSCSVNSIKSNLLSNSYTIVSTNGQCLTDFSGNAPYDYLINGNVPGQFFTANDQCKQIYGTSSGTCQYSSSSICYNLFCRDSSGNCVGTGVGAAPGTTCDSGKACISNSCTNSSLALTSDCPFGDDTIYDTEIQAVLGFLTPKLPSFSSLTSKFTCEAALDYYSANGFSKTAFCQDKRTSAYFKTTCCATCQRYAQLSCFDQLYECPSLKNQCSSTVTVLGVTNTVLFFCPRTCSACTGQLTCANNICKNGATCNNITTTSLTAFTCSCPNGYSGSLCEIKNPCLPNPCNTGVCQQFGSLGYVCSCLSGYSGYNCNVAPDGSVVTTTTPILTTTTTTTTAFPTFCSPNPCQNGGTCVNGATTYGCICFSGFTGPNCATTIANCAANPCQNGGTCTNLIGSTGYTCKCLAGYSGINCEKSYICDPNPCSNGGTCVQISATSAYCKCPSGVTGALCQFGSNVCTSKPCLNNGACNVLSTGGYSCTCQSGYYGSNCQYSGYNPCSSTTCQNGGSCTVTNAYPYYYCTCQSGYTGTNCQTMITTTTLSPSNCVDKNPINCAFYASSNFCKDNYYVQGMTVPTYCPKSCNRCSFTTTTTASPSGCYDTYSACNTWAASNYCKLYPVYLYCRKACSLC